MSESPVRPIRTIIDAGGNQYVNRILMGTATRGTVRIEWHSAVRGMITPANWSMVGMIQPMSSLLPVRFQVADAQNLIVRECLSRDFEWVLLLEDDTIPPVDLLVKLNNYMQRADTPVVSGLYYTKSEPSEPLIYRGRGTGAFLDWRMGDKVWCDGIPTGCLLIHHALLRAVWDESETYELHGQTTNRVFETPMRTWVDPENGQVNTINGTSDLEWCTRVMRGGFFKKSGWTQFEGREFPFLVDTSMLCRHITQDGEIFPRAIAVDEEAEEPELAALGVAVGESVSAGEALG